MTDRPVLEPTASHPITVEPTGKHVTVRVNGEVVADTDEALTLQEATYPAVQYIPLRDVVAARLTPSDTETYCPFKGDASYYHVVTEGGEPSTTRSGPTRSRTLRWPRSPVMSRSIRTRRTSPSHSLGRCIARSASSSSGPASPGLTLSPLRRGRRRPVLPRRPRRCDLAHQPDAQRTGHGAHHEVGARHRRLRGMGQRRNGIRRDAARAAGRRRRRVGVRTRRTDHRRRASSGCRICGWAAPTACWSRSSRPCSSSGCTAWTPVAHGASL